MTAFQLPASDSPLTFTDPKGRLWRFMPPSEALSAVERERISNVHNLGSDACDWLCYWYVDVPEDLKRLVTFELPCPHRDQRDTVRSTASTDLLTYRGETFLADLNWYRMVEIRVSSPFGAYSVSSMRLLAETWQHVTSLVGRDASWCRPVPSELRERVEDGVRLGVLFSMEREMHQMEQYFRKPNASSDYRETRELRNRFAAELTERGWTESQIDAGRRWWFENSQSRYPRWILDLPNEIHSSVIDMLEHLDESDLYPATRGVSPSEGTSELLGW